MPPEDTVTTPWATVIPPVTHSVPPLAVTALTSLLPESVVCPLELLSMTTLQLFEMLPAMVKNVFWALGKSVNWPPSSTGPSHVFAISGLLPTLSAVNVTVPSVTIFHFGLVDRSRKRSDVPFFSVRTLSPVHSPNE